MRLARVVPVQRIGGSVGAFDYEVPDGSSLVPGQLVLVSFQKKAVTGVLWDLRQPAGALTYAVKPIIGTVTTGPVLSSWQMSLMEAAAQAYDLPIGVFLAGAFPSWTKRQPPPTLSRQSKPLSRKSDVIWYNDRVSVYDQVRQPRSEQTATVLLTPTIEIAAEWHKQFSKAILVHGRLTAAQYRRVYDQVATQAAPLVIGTSKSLWLPYGSRPAVFIDQEEHVGYKQVEAYPWIDTVRLLERANVPATHLTPAPRLRTYHRLGPVPPPRKCERIIRTLGVPGAVPWLSPEVSQLLEQPQFNSIEFISPRAGFATAIICRQCQYTVACPACHRAVRMLRQDATHARCQHCQQLVPLPVRCPRCQAVEWKYAGLGPEKIWAMAKEAWGLSPATIKRIYVREYRQAGSIPTNKGARLIVFPAADALLSIPDFATEERALQFLLRLESVLNPADTIAIQTFQPQLPFWQRWSQHELTAWYASAVADRIRYGLPPIQEQWMARWRDRRRTADLPALELALQASKYAVTTTPLSISPGRRSSEMRVLLSGNNHRPLPTGFSATAIPRPWFVDKDIDSWVS